MGGKLAKIFMAAIFIILILTAIPEFLPDMEAGAAVVTDNASQPVLLRLVFQFWYLPVGLIVLGIITSAYGGLSKRSRRSRRI